MKIYISGPITGLPIAKVRADFAAAEKAIKRLGHEGINPCKLQDILNPETTTWEQFMEPALGLLRACDAVAFLPGWEKSHGSRTEYYEAMSGRKDLFYDFETIPPAGTEAADGKNEKP